jgi:septal ring factor EnvC (AmiA/AmiB activator)
MTKTTGILPFLPTYAHCTIRLASRNKDDRDARAQLTLKDKEVTKLTKRVTELEEQNAQIQLEVKDLTEELMALGHENESLQVR